MNATKYETKSGYEPKNKVQSDLSAFVFGKVQPQVQHLEDAVLGAIMLDNTAFDTANEILRKESFYTECNQAIYQAMSNLAEKPQPIDLLTVTEELRKMGAIETVGGSYHLVELTNRIGSAANIEYHCRIIAEAEIRRALIHVSTETIRECYDESLDTFEVMDSDALRRSKVEDIPNRIAESTTLETIAAELVARVEKAQTGGLIGISTGYSDLDRISSGWQNGKLVILGARPSMGKSGFVVNLAINAAKQGVTVAFFSLEMTSSEVLGRMATSESGISNDKLEGKAPLSTDERQLWMDSLGAVCKMPIRINDKSTHTVGSIRASCRKIRKQIGQDAPLMIVIDYLQLMTGENTGKGGNREQEISGISRGLKGLSKQLNAPVIALAQLSRAVETRGGDKKPILADLRESGGVEQDGDIIAFLYRPEYYQIVEDGDGNSTKNQLQVLVTKNRGGALGDVLLHYQKDTQKITEWDSFSLVETPTKIDNKVTVRGVDSDFDAPKTIDLPF